MNRLFRWYNQNRRTFWIVIATIILGYGILRTLNNYAKRVRETEEKSSSSNTTTYSAIYNNPNFSVSTETEVNKTNVNNIVSTMETFIYYCNTGAVEEAYNMLSTACKSELFKTEEEFKQKYINTYFKTKKTLQYQAWIVEGDKTIYRITLGEDMLATGGTNNKKSEDYYTIINENGASKLNIGKYIGHTDIGKQQMQNNVRITVLSKDVYLEYVKYNLKIENYTENDISLNEEGANNGIWLVDSNDLKYTAATWENIQGELITKAKTSKNISIKFLREYKPKFVETRIEFNNINLNYGKGTNKTAIKIELD